jgi:hypothetical protein
MDVTVIALPVDHDATTQELIARHGLRFPVGHGADTSAIGPFGQKELIIAMKSAGRSAKHR